MCGRIRGYQFGGTSAFLAYDSGIWARELVLSRSQFEVIDGILYHVEKDKTLHVIPPECVRRKLFDEAHSGQFGGHL